MRFSAGATIGPYRIVSVLGTGAMGEVYRVHDPRLGRDVAMKVLSSDLASERDQRRFLQEARSASALTHPNVVTVHEVGEYESIRYVVMELVEGESLRDVLARGPVPLRRAVQIAHAIAAGLAAAHARGVTHRDLKPENVMISRDGLVKLVDFGLARVDAPAPAEADETAELADRLTKSGTVVGTVGYMSPEQLSNDPSDARGDQFALGVVLYEMLTGKSPFRRKLSVETMYAILRENPPPLSDVPPELAAIVSRCLAKDPGQRYAFTTDLVDSLESVLQSTTASGSTPWRPSVRLTPRAAGSLAALILLLIVVGAGHRFLSSAQSGSERTGEARQLAILPFTQLGGGEDAALWADGLTQVVGARLGSSRGLQVITPFDAPAGNRVSDAGKIARELGANLLLRGTIHRDPVRTRIAYTLLDPWSGRQVAAAVVTGLNDDIFRLQDELSESIAANLQVPAPAPSQTDPKLASAAAQDRYLEALGLLQRYDDLPSVTRAIALLEDLCRRSPHSALLHAAAGRAHLARYGLTFESSSAEAAEKHATLAAKLDPVLPDVRMVLGELALRQGKTGEAVTEFRRFVEQQPDSADAALALASALAADGQYAGAEQQYLRAIALRPRYWAGYNRVGQFYARNGDLEQAIASFRKAAELTPDNARVQANLGAVLVQADQLDEALSILEKAVATMPTSEVWSNLGTARYLLGNFDDAAGAFERATQLTPADPLLWANLGDALRWSSSRRGDAASAFRSAITHGEAALHLNPNDALLSAVIAVCHAKSGGAEQARDYVRRAVSLAPDDPTVNYHAAVATAVLGDDVGALRLLDVAFRAGYPPTEAERERELARVRTSPDYRRLISRASEEPI